MRQPHHSRVRTMLAVLLALAVGAGTAGCAFGSATDDSSPSASASASVAGPIDVVATLNQWGSLAEQIGGDHVKVTSILGSGAADPHDFEPTAKDVKELQDATVVLSNGAGYDEWATKNLPQDVTSISVGQIVGAMDGDNPHLWFSRDARFAAAEDLAQTFSRLDPAHKQEFSDNLATWKKEEQALEGRIHEFGEDHPNLTYAATEDVAYYLMSDLGFKDTTPSGYRQAMSNGSEPSPADLKAFTKLLDEGTPDILVNNPQESNETTKSLVAAAGQGSVPVEDITEEMPKDCTDLTDWIDQLFTQISGKVAKDTASASPSETSSSVSANASGDA
ncbi:MAG: zinc ABC transporter substrate-binding protein [Bifidobacterium sp.]|nr:zinc ABC transporter substrate-binding protein [Bifidobacterium sp.]